METIASTINMITGDTALPNTELLQLTELPDDLLAILQNGAKANLRISLIDSALLTQLEINGQTFNVKLNGILPQPQPNETLDLPVKVSSGNRLQVLVPQVQTHSLTSKLQSDVKQPAVQSRSSAVDININPTKQLQKVVLEPLKLDEVVSSKLTELKAPLALKEQVMSQIPRLEINISSVGQTSSSAKSILQPIYDTIEQMVYVNANSSEIEVLQNQLQQNIADLVGKNINGTISRQQNAATFIKTDIGESFFIAPLKFSPNETVDLTINNIVFPTRTKPDNIFTQIVNLFESKNSDITIALRDNPHILSKLFSQDVTVAAEQNSPLLNTLVAKLPAYNQNFLPNLVTFYQAAVQKDAAIWLGADNIKQIAEISKDVNVAGITKELNNFVASSIKETLMWRISEIPVYADNNFTSLKIAVKKDHDDSKEAKQSKQGTRFVVETQFSKLGNFQFDGFVCAHERNLDLIVRTSSQLDDDFCTQLINLFKNSLYNFDYKGSVKINQKESFINFYEAAPRKQGIYI